MREQPKSYSGIYPALAVTHSGAIRGQDECGIGAVVAFYGRLYWITYPANASHGGLGRIYSMDEGMQVTCHEESAGGTHASRLLHLGTGQLLLGGSVVSLDGTVRSFDTGRLIGRLTAASAHLTMPEEWAYLHTMEDGLYEVNMRTMAVRCLRRDIHDRLTMPALADTTGYAQTKLPGDHGKGGYTGQGVMVYANNGHGGVLAEWDGKGSAQDLSRWTVVDANKYTEVIGPGGMEGPFSPNDPIWALGWDERSVLLSVRFDGEWTRYRLPKGSYTQDADHGWFTEWPRIRRIEDTYLMCVHGLFYRFPGQFTPAQAGWIQPICRHLKMISDWDAWQDKVVFACDDASMFENPILGRCQSNLWFAGMDALENMSEAAGFGGVFLHDKVAENEVSEPFFVGGFDERVLSVSVGDACYLSFVLEADLCGDGVFTPVETFTVGAGGFSQIALPESLRCDWVRLRAKRAVSDMTAYFHLRMRENIAEDAALAAGLHQAESAAPYSRGLLYALPGEDMRLGFASSSGYYEVGADMCLARATAPEDLPDLTMRAPLDPVCRETPHSVLVIDRRGRPFHLPKCGGDYGGLSDRQVREVVTERSLMNLCGTVYELPRPESGGVRRIKPVTTHGRRIGDLCSWRGMLVLSGVDDGAMGEHILCSDDRKAALWLGNVDDLWRFGAPRGEGGPLLNSEVTAGRASDPYLIYGYRHREVLLRHDRPEDVRFTLDVDVVGDGTFMPYTEAIVPAGEGLTYAFPDAFAAHWVSVRVGADCLATAWFRYT